MTWLGEWLKQVVIVVLIAVFIDLLLPNRAMERYVKFVVSLLILLTLLTPVMRLFSPDAKEKLEAAFSESFYGGVGMEAGPSTEVILRQGEQLRKKEESEALQWAGEETARQMKDQIERETGQPIERVTVKLAAKTPESKERNKEIPVQSGPSLEVSAVEVLLARPSPGPPDSKGEEKRSLERDQKISVAPVERVKINITPDDNPDASDVENEETEGKEVPEAPKPEEEKLSVPASAGNSVQPDAALVTRIGEVLNRNWGVPKEAVSVTNQVEEAEQ